MRHKLLVLAVKKLSKSVYIYGSYRRIKTGVPLFGPPGKLLSTIGYHSNSWASRYTYACSCDVQCVWPGCELMVGLDWTSLPTKFSTPAFCISSTPAQVSIEPPLPQSQFLATSIVFRCKMHKPCIFTWKLKRYFWISFLSPVSSHRSAPGHLIHSLLLCVNSYSACDKHVHWRPRHHGRARHALLLTTEWLIDSLLLCQIITDVTVNLSNILQHTRSPRDLYRRCVCLLHDKNIRSLWRT